MLWSFFDPKMHSFLIDLLNNVGGFLPPRPSKMELSLTRNAHFRKVTFFAAGTVVNENLVEKDSQNGAKMACRNSKSMTAFHD